MAYTAPTAAYPSDSNVFIRDHAASGKLVVDFARNPRDFAVNKYMQVIPVKKTQGLYMQMTIEEAGRIQQTDLSNFIWADGQPAAEGNDGSESFAWLTFRTTRFNFPVLLGDKTVDQSDWNITAQYSSIKARQAMTARTVLSVAAMTNTNNYPSTHWLDISGAGGGSAGTVVSGNQGTWAESTSVRQDIKRSLNVGAELILKDTLNGVKLNELIVVVSPTLAREMSESQELVDYLKHSPDALAQVRGELPGQNVMFGLPDKLYGYPIVVEATYMVTTAKGMTTNRQAVLNQATPFMCARPGGLEGVANAPTFATGVVFEYEAMTAETLKDVPNRRQIIRVVDDIGAYVVAPVSGILFNNAG
jgi:hypothetical protein